MILTKKQLRRVIRQVTESVVDGIISEGFNVNEFVKWYSFKEPWEVNAFIDGWNKTTELLRASPPTSEEMKSLNARNSGHYASMLRDRMEGDIKRVIEPHTSRAKYPNSAINQWLRYTWHNMVSSLVSSELKMPGVLNSLPTGKIVAKAITQKELDRRAQRVSDLKGRTEKIVKTLEDVDPKSITRGPTYGHTSIGVTYAPENLSDGDAVYWLLDKFTGAPMWKFLIHRNPDDGRIYAYTEIDSSG